MPVVPFISRFPVADGAEIVDRRLIHHRLVQIEQVGVGNRVLPNQVVDQVDGAGMAVYLLVIAQRFAADGQPVFEHHERFAQRQGVAFDGGGVVRPDRRDLGQQGFAEIAREAVGKQFACGGLFATRFGEREDGIVRNIELMPPVQLFGGFSIAHARIEKREQLFLMGCQFGLERFSRHNVTTILPIHGNCNDNIGLIKQISRYSLPWCRDWRDAPKPRGFSTCGTGVSLRLAGLSPNPCCFKKPGTSGRFPRR